MTTHVGSANRGHTSVQGVIKGSKRLTSSNIPKWNSEINGAINVVLKESRSNSIYLFVCLYFKFHRKHLIYVFFNKFLTTHFCHKFSLSQ